MEDELELFFKEAQSNKLCNEYTDEWLSIKTKREFVDFSLRAASIIYMAIARCNGWGLSNRYILDNFGAYINGNYVSQPDKEINYTCEYFVEYKDVILTDCNAIVLIDCNATIELHDYQVLTVFTWGKSKIKFTEAKNTIV